MTTVSVTKVGFSYRVTVTHAGNTGSIWYPTAQAALTFAHLYQVPVEVNIQ